MAKKKVSRTAKKAKAKAPAKKNPKTKALPGKKPTLAGLPLPAKPMPTPAAVPELTAQKSKGTLYIIGGHEDKQNDRVILKEIVNRVGDGTLCIATVASTVGNELWEEYKRVFTDLGVKNITHLDVVTRKDSVDIAAQKAVENACAVFFTGGDQLRITSELGGTAIADRIHEIYEHGGVIAGTSAGASVMGETMLVSGPGVSSFRVGAGLAMAPGLGLVKNLLIDQHFAERGRIGRLIGATAHNPKYIGVGIDENTAIVIDDTKFKVIGAGAVYVLDAHQATDCNLSEAQADTALSIFNVRFHLLSAGDQYDLKTQKPVPH